MINAFKTFGLDTWTVAKNWTLNLSRMGWMVAKHGPFDFIYDFYNMPWLSKLAQVNQLLTTVVNHRTGRYREANAIIVSTVVEQLIENLEGVFYDRDLLVLHEDMVPPEILHAMGLKTWMVEMLGILLPIVQHDYMEHYIDVAENAGVPPDVCSLPKATIGLALSNHLPKGLAMVTSNSPCDGGMASYTIMEKHFNIPTFRIDVPYNFNNERAIKYFAEELKRMIKWLEEYTPGKMDWDKLVEICEERNRAVEYELELWDMIRSRPAPMAAEVVYLSHLWGANVCPGHVKTTEMFKKLAHLCRENLKEGIAAIPNETYRTVLWNPPTLHFFDMISWAEQTWGVALIMDSMTYNSQPLIDTSSRDSMLQGLAKNIMEGPMARHTRGPAENYFHDIFQIYKQFNLDMVWVAGHIGCKNTAALNGILREKCRNAQIPLLIINYDLSDPRIVSREDMKMQVEQFMENIMKTNI